MAFYNLAAEAASLVIICLATISFALNESKGTTRYGALKWMQLATLVSIVATLASLITADFFMDYPLWMVTALKYMYFFTCSIAAPMALFYGITLIYPKTYKINFFRKYYWAWLPYAIYCLFVATNGIHKLIFTISPTIGYVRGEWFKVSYIIAFYYFGLVIYFTIKNFKSPQRLSLLLVFLNLFVATIIFCTQLIFPPLQLSGLASVVGVLIIQFYIHNVSQNTDPLTELLNRASLTKRMTKLSETNTPYSLFVFSIRNFKGINERNGLNFGDTLLEQIALRFRTLFLNKQVFRYSGDEFALLLPNCDKALKQKIQDMCVNLKLPFYIDDSTFTIEFVYARVDFPQFGTKTQEIMSAMDYSLSIIKKSTNDTINFYDIKIVEQMKRRNYVIERIKKALATDGFEMFYQPIYSIKLNEFSMAEALIRFKQDQGDFISPGEFIPIAEDTGLIVKITETILELVCSDYRQLVQQFGSNLKLSSISVNFPYTMLMKKGVAKEVYDTVTCHNLSPDMIKIELTERTFATDLNAALQMMQEFLNYGFSFELDDFGVEYSNFSMFFRVPLNIIKFDRSFVVSSTSNKKHRDFFNKFLIAIKSLDRDIEVVMEGVEDEELKSFLIECGCDYIQGYVFSKPLPFGDYCNFIAERSAE